MLTSKKYFNHRGYLAPESSRRIYNLEEKLRNPREFIFLEVNNYSNYIIWFYSTGFKGLTRVSIRIFSKKLTIILSKLTREIYTENLRAVTRNFAQLCEIARNYVCISSINFPGYIHFWD